MIEAAIDALKTTFINNLSAMLATIDGEKDDGITLDEIADDNIYTSEIEAADGFPCIVMVSESGEIDYRPSSVKDTTHLITIACAATDTNEEHLTRRLFRYLNAIERVLEADHTLNGEVLDVIPKRYYQEPMFFNEDALLKDFRLQVEVITRGTYV